MKTVCDALTIAASSGECGLRDRALAIATPLVAVAYGQPRGHYTAYGSTWDNGISRETKMRRPVLPRVMAILKEGLS